MKGALISLLVMGAVAAGLTFYWDNNTSAMQAHVEKNLLAARKKFDVAGEGITLSWERIERHAFPLGKGVRVIAPSITRKNGVRHQGIFLDYVDITPRKEDLSRIQVEGPLRATAEDADYGAFALAYAQFPSVMFRTPAEEKALAGKHRSIVGGRRATPADVLSALPEDLAYQYSVVLPAQFSLTVTQGGVKKTVAPASMVAAGVRMWRTVDYRLARELDILFAVLDGTAAAQ